MLIETYENRDADTCIDRAHAVCSDRKGYSDLFVARGRGSMAHALKKLGCATIISTEAELVSNRERFLKCA